MIRHRRRPPPPLRAFSGEMAWPLGKRPPPLDFSPCPQQNPCILSSSGAVAVAAPIFFFFLLQAGYLRRTSNFVPPFNFLGLGLCSGGGWVCFWLVGEGGGCS